MTARRICTKCGASISKLSKNRKRCLDCSPRRAAPATTAPAPDSLLKAYDRAIEANDRLDPEDDALVAAGRKIAAQIDYAAEYLTGQELTKALYLMPHLVNVLKEMLATPSARKDLKDASEGTSGKLSSLQDAARRHARKSA